MASYESVNDLINEYRILAKRADQRMVELEAKRYEAGYENILNYAYARAQYDLKKWANPKARAEGKRLRFNTKPPTLENGDINVRSLREKMKVLKRFLSSDTSTINPTKETKGVKAVLMQPALTINEKYGTNLSWQSLGSFFEGGLYEKLHSEIGGTDIVLKALAVLNKNKEKVLHAIEENSLKNLQLDSPFTYKQNGRSRGKEWKKGDVKEIDPIVMNLVKKTIKSKKHRSDLMEYLQHE